MKKRIIDLRNEEPLLDVVSYGRGGQPLSPAQVAEIKRVVHRAPEVMVKVSGGARTLAGVARHVRYIGRKGELEMETDMGQSVRGRDLGEFLIRDWDLDIEAFERHSQRQIRPGRKPPKLVHNVIFSMPPGTPPDRLLRAVRRFALEEFALVHRYTLALHTDEPHPHVHVVIKAMSEQGQRLNIRKATLRDWRRKFAQRLREQGLEATATERAVRGQGRKALRDGIYRANLRGESTHVAKRDAEAIRNAAMGDPSLGLGKDRLQRTRSEVVDGWNAVGHALRIQGEHGVAGSVARFVHKFPEVRTDKETIVDLVQQRMRARQPPIIR
jgi:Relaxase/Mobilisation nuclease domain